MINFSHIQDYGGGAEFQLTIEAPSAEVLVDWLVSEFGNKSALFRFTPNTVVQEPDLMLDESGDVIYVKSPLSKKNKPWLYWPKKIDREIEYQQVNDSSYSYIGSIQNRNEQVHVVGIKNEIPLNLGDSLKLCNHSPDGFSWGYNGSGPAQLALAILLHEFQDPYLALEYYQDFKSEIISNWEKDSPFCINSSDIREWLFSKVLDYNTLADKLIEKLIPCQRVGFVSGQHWKERSLEQALLDVGFLYKKEIDRLGFCKIKISVGQRPDYICPGWDLTKIYKILDDFNYVQGFVYSKSPIPKRIDFNHAYSCGQVENNPKVSIVGAYENGLFHIYLED